MARIDREEVRRLQRRLGVVPDGVVGSETLAALAERLGCAATVASIQMVLRVPMDGILGSVTLGAAARAVGAYAVDAQMRWPLQSDVRSGGSVFGKAGDESRLVNVVPPFPVYFEGQRVRSIRVHEVIADDVREALEEVLAHYGLERIRKLKLDQYGGSYNYRPSRGGSSLSMHAWGIALDWMPAENALRMGAPEAVLSGAEYRAWWEIWELHGAVSLGRERNYDWMHLQFARLG
ncbi:MAG: hypothetical protein IKY92_07180 [Akkermansia sp.]|nr:hypothetical protein [Akkermansia sp.]